MSTPSARRTQRRQKTRETEARMTWRTGRSCDNGRRSRTTELIRLAVLAVLAVLASFAGRGAGTQPATRRSPLAGARPTRAYLPRSWPIPGVPFLLLTTRSSRRRRCGPARRTACRCRSLRPRRCPRRAARASHGSAGLLPVTRRPDAGGFSRTFVDTDDVPGVPTGRTDNSARLPLVPSDPRPSPGFRRGSAS